MVPLSYYVKAQDYLAFNILKHSVVNDANTVVVLLTLEYDALNVSAKVASS
jgi:hypothetical protein